MFREIDISPSLWTDERGWALALAKAAGRANDPLKNLHIATIAPGSIRGNHYHSDSAEWLMTFGGRAQLAFKCDGQDKTVLEVDAANPKLFKIDRNVTHTIKNISSADIMIVAFNEIDAPQQQRDEIIS